MRQRLQFAARLAGALVVLVGVGILVWMELGTDRGQSRAEASPTAVITRGNYQRYVYAISDMSGESKKLAQFDPALPADEAVVLGALKSAAKDSYGMIIPEDAQPTVEIRSEINYVTFTVSARKIWFELFRNSNGQVGAVHMWTEGN